MTEENKKHIPNPDGRPVINIIEPINDSAENVAKSIMIGVGKKNWDYMKNKG